MVYGGSENNLVTISGKVNSEPKFSHEVYGETFYQFEVEVPRLSDLYDKVPVLVSERLVEKDKLIIGTKIEVEGQFRSYNNYNSQGSKLVLTVFVRELNFLDEGEAEFKNEVELDGFVCKKPIYRKTPFGREISDILLAVNRKYNKSDYIPCIAWGRNARYCEQLKIGDNIKIWGRIQSREYQKKDDKGESIAKVAYEVSVAKLEVVHKRVENNESNEDNENTKVDIEINEADEENT